jgi:hypothetical protein
VVVVPVLGGPNLRCIELIEIPNLPLGVRVIGHPLIPKAVLLFFEGKRIAPSFVMLLFNNLCREDSHTKCVFFSQRSGERGRARDAMDDTAVVTSQWSPAQ